MRLPDETTKRHGLYRDVMRTCELPSREERRDRFRRMRSLYLTGTDAFFRGYYNGLKAWAARSASMVYASENVQFGLTTPPYYGDRWDEELNLAREEFHRLWFDGVFPDVAGNLVLQAHYADTAIAKVHLLRNEVTMSAIADPSDLCVLDERVGWEQQEAMVHFYTLGIDAFRRLLDAIPDVSMRERLFAAAEADARPHEDTRGDFMPPAVQSLILAQASPTMTGNVQSIRDTALAIARSRAPVVQLAELWVWDDRAGRLCEACGERKSHWRHHWSEPEGHEFKPGEYVPDWRVATLVPESTTMDVLWEPINPHGVEGHPFFPLTLEPIEDYIWGVAPMEHQVAIQLLRERKMAGVDIRDDLRKDPPASYYGISTRDGEGTKVWRKPGGDIPFTNPQSKVEFHPPKDVPEGEFFFVDKLDAMSAEQSGMPRGMSGLAEPQGAAGPRSGDQDVARALLGSGPTRARAMVIEKWIQAIGTYTLRLHREILDRPLVKNDGSHFLLRQMPGDFVARVWAHSTSPIYTEHLTQKALLARKTGDISGEDFLTFLSLPGTDMLLRRQKKLEESRSKQGAEVLDLKKRETQSKILKNEKQALK